MKKLIEIQNELKVPKGNFNSFGKYKYRSAEDILEAVKPILKKHGCWLAISDSIEVIGGKLFLKATANFNSNECSLIVNGYAELGEHKGMSSEQCTGTASSYARKYALNGLFLIDETEADPDHSEPKKPFDVSTLKTTEQIKQAYNNKQITKEQAIELESKLNPKN